MASPETLAFETKVHQLQHEINQILIQDYEVAPGSSDLAEIWRYAWRIASGSYVDDIVHDSHFKEEIPNGKAIFNKELAGAAYRAHSQIILDQREGIVVSDIGRIFKASYELWERLHQIMQEHNASKVWEQQHGMDAVANGEKNQ